MPTLWSWQAELTLYQLAAQPEAQGVLSNLTDVAQSTKVFAQTAQGLPQLVNDQRQAAINQIFDRLAVERTNLLADLGGEETKLRGLLSEARQTLQSGGQMADSVNAAIKSLDAFVQYVSPPETNPAPAAVDTNSHPFNVLDYGDRRQPHRGHGHQSHHPDPNGEPERVASGPPEPPGHR